jgi:hypothetical protein
MVTTEFSNLSYLGEVISNYILAVICAITTFEVVNFVTAEDMITDGTTDGNPTDAISNPEDVKQRK